MRSAAVWMDSIEVHEKEPLTEDLHLQDEEGEGREQVEPAPDNPRAEATGKWDPDSSHYQWDEEEDGMDNHTITYRSSTI